MAESRFKSVSRKNIHKTITLSFLMFHLIYLFIWLKKLETRDSYVANGNIFSVKAIDS